MGQWGATFHVKHEHKFAISWGLFHFHTSQKLGYLPISHTNSPPTNRITKPFTKGGEVFIIPLGNTLYNHPPLSNSRIVSYIYKNSNLLTYHHQLPLTKSPYLPINTTPLPWNHLKIIERYIVKPTKLLGFKGICYQKCIHMKFPKP